MSAESGRKAFEDHVKAVREALDGSVEAEGLCCQLMDKVLSIEDPELYQGLADLAKLRKVLKERSGKLRQEWHCFNEMLWKQIEIDMKGWEGL